MRSLFVLATILALASCNEHSIADLPSPGNRPAMARFVVNNANWVSYGYMSTKCGSGNKGCPGNMLLATSDGKVGCGSGTPYFFASRHHPSVVELLDNDARGAVVMSLAQTKICTEKGWDPQDPRCAHVVINGNFVKLDKAAPEYAVAKEALLTRHPQFNYYPSGHDFFFAKLNITSIGIINTFGGPVDVDVKEYYKVKC